jgi:hypothetical protein
VLHGQIESRQEAAAEAELAEVTWVPQITSFARKLRRPKGEGELWTRLSLPAVHKNKVRGGGALAIPHGQPASHACTCLRPGTLGREPLDLVETLL